VEVARIWTGFQWQLPKFLFFVNRYIVPLMLFFNASYPTIYNLSIDVCTFVLKWTAWPTLISLATVQILLIVRVHAIYQRSKGILYFLGAVFIGNIISFTVIAILLVQRATIIPGIDVLPGCAFIASPDLWTAWVPPVVFESVVVVLTIYKVIQLRQKYLGNRRTRQTPHILYMLARDSFVYFLIMFSVLLANLFLSKFQKGYYSAILNLPSSAIACIAGSRMTIHLHSRDHTRQYSRVTGFTGDDFGFPTVEDDDL